MTNPAGKTRALAILIFAEIAGMSVWFSSAAVIADLKATTGLSPMVQAMLASGVQAGFAVGALLYAALGLADRFDPRRVFALSALAAAVANAGLLLAPTNETFAVFTRVMTGGLLAGVYPVGMKIAVGWGSKDRGLLVGLLVGALTLGSAAPHLLAFAGGADWRLAVAGSSGLAVLGGGAVLFAGLGPHHASAPAFRFDVLKRAWTDPRIRLAYAGYLGHMWELYAMWAWIGVALSTAFAATMPPDAAAASAKLAAFAAVGAGAIACVAAGFLADRIGKTETTIIAMAGSGLAALAAAATFDGPPALFAAVVFVWGIFIIADSAQFSALVADAAPPEAAGALLTLQTALGFALTVVTVQSAPLVASAIGWPGLFCVLAIGPALGVAAMSGLRANRTR
ncbi:MAG: MFS transporter [Pseudomonadota bacterium]